MTGRIAFQGEPGAYSHQACRDARPDLEPLPCRTFEDAIEAVRKGEAELAMLPVENTTYGRVADIHRLLPASGLHIVDEAFVRVHINLLAVPGAQLHEVRRALSHIVLLRPVPRLPARARDRTAKSAPTTPARRPRSRGAAIPPAPRSPPTSRPRSTASTSSPATSRTTSTTPPASWSCRASPTTAAAARRG